MMAAPIVTPPPAVVDKFRTAERQLAVTAAIAVEDPTLSDAQRMDRIRTAWWPYRQAREAFDASFGDGS